MAVRIDTIQIKYKKRLSAVRGDSILSKELGEALIEMYPALIESGATLSQLTKVLWDKEC